MVSMNQLDTDTRVRIVSALIEGVGINATARMVGVSKNTILKLLRELGAACEAFHDEKVVGLRCKHIQCDEIWSFVHCKAANTPSHLQGVYGVGDVWTWTAVDADTRLMVQWTVGLRDADTAHDFMQNIRARLSERVQISTDGFRAYGNAIANNFDVDTFSSWAKCIKTYEDDGEGKYSPGRCTGIEKTAMWGNPDLNRCSTSYVERQNLTIRMSNRRFTRLTNAHSKKIENHCNAMALNFVHYNFCRKHQSLGMKTPAMASGLTDHVWTVEELISLVDSN